MTSRLNPTVPGVGPWLWRGDGLRGTIVCDHHGPVGGLGAGFRRAAFEFCVRRSAGWGARAVLIGSKEVSWLFRMEGRGR